jgi:hypothetical protein
LFSGRSMPMIRGAPRIHGELPKLGFEISERSVSRWIRRAPRDADPVKRWLTFPRNHREAIAATDFCTVSTLTFAALYCCFVIAHDRRKILHLHVTRIPMLFGWYSKYAKQGPTNSRADSCYSTETQSLESMWFRPRGTSEASQLARPCAVRGRTVLLNARLEVAGATCFWISSTTGPLRGSVLDIRASTQNSKTLDLQNLPVVAVF